MVIYFCWREVLAMKMKIIKKKIEKNMMLVGVIVELARVQKHFPVVISVLVSCARFPKEVQSTNQFASKSINRRLLHNS